MTIAMVMMMMMVMIMITVAEKNMKFSERSIN